MAKAGSPARRAPPTDDDLASFQAERRVYFAVCATPTVLALAPVTFTGEFARGCWTGGFFALPVSLYFVVWGSALRSRGLWTRQATRGVTVATLVASAPLWFVPFLTFVMVSNR